MGVPEAQRAICLVGVDAMGTESVDAEGERASDREIGNPKLNSSLEPICDIGVRAEFGFVSLRSRISAKAGKYLSSLQSKRVTFLSLRGVTKERIVRRFSSVIFVLERSMLSRRWQQVSLTWIFASFSHPVKDTCLNAVQSDKSMDDKEREFWMTNFRSVVPH